MATVAEQLRAARESRGLSIQQVAETTKIRSDHIRALEAGDYDVFVAPVYIRGFTRTYAGLLKLDVLAVMAELDRELDNTGKFREPPSLSGRERTSLDFLMLQLSRVNLRTLLGLLVVLILVAATIGAFMAWRRHALLNSMEGVGEGLYRPRNVQQQGETLPVPQSPQHR